MVVGHIEASASKRVSCASSRLAAALVSGDAMRRDHSRALIKVIFRWCSRLRSEVTEASATPRAARSSGQRARMHDVPPTASTRLSAAPGRRYVCRVGYSAAASAGTPLIVG
ncbi:unnamed protein product [Chrysodeixis includens]|uniref:Uncharacterized protein n=1 Tax=Chrysodeixis includens TaxID=689277 RepID=A0A9N8KZS0_CHRIL|nr:unnamed protein product [Chrysodeixis includens]